MQAGVENHSLSPHVRIGEGGRDRPLNHGFDREGKPMPRLFTGLQVPPAVRAVLSGLRGGLHGARWISPDHYHLTLRFFGDMERERASALDACLMQLAHAPFTVQVSQLRVFGGDKPRALVASVDPDPVLLDLQADQERLARRLGFAPATRKFSPHITLARLKEANAFQVAGFLSGLGALPSLQISVDHFALFSSREGSGGGPYLIEALYPLEDGLDEEQGWDQYEIA